VIANFAAAVIVNWPALLTARPTRLYYVSQDNKLMAVSLKTEGGTLQPSTPRELFRLPIVDTGRPPYDVTADGQRFLVGAVSGQAGQPLNVIVN
jgi:hypothetical protein